MYSPFKWFYPRLPNNISFIKFSHFCHFHKNEWCIKNVVFLISIFIIFYNPIILLGLKSKIILNMEKIITKTSWKDKSRYMYKYVWTGVKFWNILKCLIWSWKLLKIKTTYTCVKYMLLTMKDMFIFRKSENIPIMTTRREW